MANDNFIKNQTEIVSAVLKKMDGGKPFDLLSEEKGIRPFQGIVVSESLWEPSVKGTLYVTAKNSEGELFNITGHELLEVVIKTPTLSTDESENDRQEFRFHVTKVTEISDSASLTIEGKGGPSSTYVIEFQPFELEFFDKQNPLDSPEFIGKIAGEDGLVDYLAERFFSPDSTDYSSVSEDMDVEPTLNSVWYKSSQGSYPYGKTSKRMDLGQLMNHLSENAVSSENSSAANYLFWQDLNRWHFRSIDSLIRDADNIKTYEVKFGDPSKQSIDSFTFTKKIDQRELLISQAYKSFYTHVSPIYYDSYSNYLTTSNKLKRSNVTYDYYRDYDRWNHLEEYPLLPENLNNQDSDGGEIKDPMYGYFNTNEYNDPNPTKLDNTTSNSQKNTMVSWQTMFDQTDLSYELLKTIRQDIIGSKAEAINQYVLKRLLKEKWNVYKYSICCIDQPEEVIEDVGYGMIVNYSKDPDSYYYDYRIAPVELWTNDATVDPERILNSSFPSSPILVAAKGITGEDENIRVTTINAYNITEIFNGPNGSSYGVKKYDFTETYSSESHKPEPIECGLNGESESFARNFNQQPCFCEDSSPCDQAIPDPCCYPCGGAPTGTNQGPYGLCQWCQPDWVDPSNPCNIPGGECGDYPGGEPSVAYCDGINVTIDTICNFCCQLNSGQIENHQAMQPCCAGSPDDGTLTCRTINGELVYPLCSDIQNEPSYDPEYCGEDAQWVCCAGEETGICCPTNESTYQNGYSTCQIRTEAQCTAVGGEFNPDSQDCGDCQPVLPPLPAAGCCKCIWDNFPYCNSLLVFPDNNGEYDYGPQPEFVANCESEGGTVIYGDGESDPCNQCTQEVACPPQEEDDCCFEGFGGLTFDYYRQFDRYKYDSIIGAVGSIPSVTEGNTFDCVRFEEGNSGGYQLDGFGTFDPLSPHPKLKGTIVKLYRVNRNDLNYIVPNEFDNKQYMYFFEAAQPMNHMFMGEHHGISCGFDNPEGGEIPVNRRSCGIKLPPSDELPPPDLGAN